MMNSAMGADRRNQETDGGACSRIRQLRKSDEAARKLSLDAASFEAKAKAIATGSGAKSPQAPACNTVARH